MMVQEQNNITTILDSIKEEELILAITKLEEENRKLNYSIEKKKKIIEILKNEQLNK